MTTAELLREALRQQRYPLSSGYDPAWVVRADGAASVVVGRSVDAGDDARAGMRVLDLDCGRESFDAIVSFGAFHYFGTDASFIAACAEFVKPGETIGVVMSGLGRDPGRSFRHT
ncbi:hypothetical protein [Kribbella sp. DT2]|uniref:hypothetical protein n=1 Tax=Kribbella sp. DT2 TaxID=3393427 RepID=UPI003CF7BDD8